MLSFYKSLVQKVSVLSMFPCYSLRACSQIPVYGLTGRALGGHSVAPNGILRAKSWNKVHFMRRYQWRSQGLPGWASRPPGKPKWRRKWKKMRKNERTYRKMRKDWGNVLILPTQEWEAGYGPGRYPFMNNNGCQIYFILLPNLLVWIEIINIKK